MEGRCGFVRSLSRIATLPQNNNIFWPWAHPSFSLGELGTFYLFELPAFLWGTLAKNESKLLEMF